jgi:acyl-coenzyme A thioesterase PaaI-like protein
MSQSLQERFGPGHICFGCGPANPQGLRIRSFEQGEEVVASWRASPHHQAFPGMVAGGIVGTLLDCHSNWTAALHLMKAKGLGQPPCTVTADYAVTLKRPIPADAELHLRAKVVEASGNKAVVEAALEADGKLRAACRGTFVAVREGHPAFNRW